MFSGCCVPLMSICEQWGLQAPLGAAELYREGSCSWRCLFPTSLMVRGHCPVFPDQHWEDYRGKIIKPREPLNRPYDLQYFIGQATLLNHGECRPHGKHRAQPHHRLDRRWRWKWTLSSHCITVWSLGKWCNMAS